MKMMTILSLLVVTEMAQHCSATQIMSPVGGNHTVQKVGVESTSAHTTPHPITPHPITPHHTTPHHNTPHPITSTTPNYTTSHHTPPHQHTSHHTIPLSKEAALATILLLLDGRALLCQNKTISSSPGDNVSCYSA